MQIFTSELLREKFVIHNPNVKGAQKSEPVVALSNRFVTNLRDHHGGLVETLIVRAQNMHTAVRMGARLISAFNQGGVLGKRYKEEDWENIWHSVISNYEKTYNPKRWVALYKDGKCIFERGERHPFLDMIEKCDHENKKEYDYAIPLAEKLFKSAGKNLEIIHNPNVALNVNFENNEGRLGIILRGPTRTNTFSFSVRPQKKPDMLNIPQCLGTAAAFLEGIQLAYLVGTNIIKIRLGIIERFSKEEKQTREGRQRLNRLQAEIANLENDFDVRYRPEKPEFQFFLAEAEELAEATLEAPE